MTPFELILWGLAAAVAIFAVGVSIAIVLTIIPSRPRKTTTKEQTK